MIVLENFHTQFGSDQRTTTVAFMEKRLVEEINKLNTQGMQVYHPVLKRIVLVTLKLYVFLADRPDKSDLLDVLSSKFCSRFGYAGDMTNIMKKMVCCKTCYKKLSTPSTDTSSEGCEDCFNLIFFAYNLRNKRGKISTYFITRW